jgi:hypothetical protein
MAHNSSISSPDPYGNGQDYITANASETLSVYQVQANANRNRQQRIQELKTIHLHDWQQSDLNHESERAYFTATYYLKKGNRLLLLGTCMQFAMLILSLSGSYISSFANMQDNSKSILMSVLNMSTAILSGVYTFFGFTKKGQSFKEASTVLFTKVEKVKLAISTLKSDREYEELKANLIETLIKYDTETIREKINGKHYIPVYREELEEGLVRKIHRDKDNSIKMIIKDSKSDNTIQSSEVAVVQYISNSNSSSDENSSTEEKKLEELGKYQS